MHKILLIDDDAKLAEVLASYLSSFNLQLISALQPSTGLKCLSDSSIELIILDIMLPEMDGFEVLKRIRANNTIPVIMLTARGDVMDRVVGLELGADDYLPKPFEPRELVARINAILKRVVGKTNDSAKMLFGPLYIDSELQEAKLDNKTLPLSTMEFRLLELLAHKKGHTLSRDEILNQLKGIETEIFSRSIDIMVSRLRQKLKPYEMIKTLRGLGYRFVVKE
jgi:two-component system, OmpR family, response regulator